MLDVMFVVPRPNYITMSSIICTIHDMYTMLIVKDMYMYDERHVHTYKIYEFLYAHAHVHMYMYL